jgi:hypothetical protein
MRGYFFLEKIIGRVTKNVSLIRIEVMNRGSRRKYFWYLMDKSIVRIIIRIPKLISEARVKMW